MAPGALIVYGCAAHPTSVDAPAAGGSIATRPGRPGVVIAAPHGTSDPKTADIAAELARRTGFGLVVATGFALEPARVYEAYEERVREAAQGRLVFYAEIHGNNRWEAAARIEVAAVGVGHDDAIRLRTLLELIRDAYLRNHPKAPRLEVRVEPADPVVDAATGAKRVGILRWPERALYVELPRAARTEWQEVYTTILADFLTQAGALLSLK